jgi:hypothetical protein
MNIFFSIERKRLFLKKVKVRSYRKGSCRARLKVEQFGTSISLVGKSFKRNSEEMFILINGEITTLQLEGLIV